MTTIDDVDLFGETFSGFRDVSTSRRHPAWLTALVLLVGVALVGAGLVWLRGVQAGPSTAEPVDAVTLLDVFAAPQRPADVLPDADLQGLGLDTSTTRYLVDTPTGAQYAAVNTSGDLCVVTVVAGELPGLGCAHAVRGMTFTGTDLKLVTDGGPAPAASEGWREAGPQLFVKN
ncbi:hypothetical protein Cch01nite_37470 [Cellulomonas chitinilytica]|uniref:Uncharacterized protein n=1 Tax=Cellulomonas chitinilytica TaxID=398759 RepID=A0A919P6T0_9CELL|nr:hypothetical protein [Cellulomonas chitinilytica]GIG23023.1 hypothetical protein Cch01nite_37470 [Cellulomonas chitinilytica]